MFCSVLNTQNVDRTGLPSPVQNSARKTASTGRGFRSKFNEIYHKSDLKKFRDWTLRLNCNHCPLNILHKVSVFKFYSIHPSQYIRYIHWESKLTWIHIINNTRPWKNNSCSRQIKTSKRNPQQRQISAFLVNLGRVHTSHICHHCDCKIRVQ